MVSHKDKSQIATCKKFTQEARNRAIGMSQAGLSTREIGEAISHVWFVF